MSLPTGIEPQNNLNNVLNEIINSMNEAISTMAEMQQMISRNVSAVSLTNIQNEVTSALSSVEELQAAIRDIDSPIASVDMEVDSSGIQNLNRQIKEVELLFQGVASIQQNIDSQSRAMRVLPFDIAARVREINTDMEEMHQTLSIISENPFHMDSQAVELQIVSLTNRLRETLQAQQELHESLSHTDVENEQPPPVETPQPEPVEVPVVWQTDDNLEVFTDTGIDRFRLEVESANSMLEQLSSTQDSIARQAYDTNVFPPAAFQNLNELAIRIDMLRNRMQQIADNPINMGTDGANTEIEQLRLQLDRAVQEQNELNSAMQNMDVSTANNAYLRLSQTVANTERYVRDNVDEQGQFNSVIQEGTSFASNLNGVIEKAVAAFSNLIDTDKITSFVSEGMESFDSQLKAENQLMSVLANTLDDKHVTEHMLNVTTNSSEAMDEINAISGADDIVITVDAKTEALQDKFDAITSKAGEISSKGIYGEDALVTGATELSSYFTDTDAIEMMMDNLSNYAMGASGGGELDSSAITEYAADLGNIMSGDYDAMAKKGFEFTGTQQAIIEGTATEAQIVAALGEEYLNMSQDMQAAGVISQVINASWSGLYETMSNTPEGKIIQMTSAWDDMKQMVAEQLYPYIILLVDTITENWDIIETIISGFMKGLQNILAVIDWLGERVAEFASFIMDNWSVISPIIWGIVAALAVYGAYLAINKGIELASAAASGAVTIAKGMQAAATWLVTKVIGSEAAAQAGLNSTMLACPVVWLVVMIIALITILMVLCNWIANVTGVANSGFGVITGGINVVIQFFKNLALTVANIALGIGYAIAALASNMTTAFHNAICSIQSWFYNLLSTGLTVIEGICEALNKLPFVEFDYSGISNAADKYAEKAAEADKNKKEYKDISAAFDEGFHTFDTFQDGWISKAFEAGADWGDGVTEAVSNFNLTDALGLDDELDNPEDYKASAEDYLKTLGGTDSGLSETDDSNANLSELDEMNANLNELDNMNTNLSNISDNTDDISDSLEISEENLKYLRDLAEQDAVNRFTTAEITIEQNNTNNIKSEMDLDGVISGMTDAVNEAINVATEGVH